MTSLEQFALAGVFGLLGLVGMAIGGSSLRSWHRIRNEDIDTVAAATGGDRVQLEGTARPVGDPMTSPVEGEPCLAYRARLEFVETGLDEEENDAEHDGRVLGRRREREAFLLEAGDGTALVDPEGRDVTSDISGEVVRKSKKIGELAFGDVPDDRERGIPQEWQDAFDDLDPGGCLEEGGMLADDGEIVYTAELLSPEETCYVDGAGHRPDEVDRDVPKSADAVVRSAKGSDAPDALVSGGSKAGTAKNYRNRGVFVFLVGVGFLAGAVSIVVG